MLAIKVPEGLCAINNSLSAQIFGLNYFGTRANSTFIALAKGRSRLWRARAYAEQCRRVSARVGKPEGTISFASLKRGLKKSEPSSSSAPICVYFRDDFCAAFFVFCKSQLQKICQAAQETHDLSRKKRTEEEEETIRDFFCPHLKFSLNFCGRCSFCRCFATIDRWNLSLEEKFMHTPRIFANDEKLLYIKSCFFCCFLLISSNTQLSLGSCFVSLRLQEEK